MSNSHENPHNLPGAHFVEHHEIHVSDKKPDTEAHFEPKFVPPTIHHEEKSESEGGNNKYLRIGIIIAVIVLLFIISIGIVRLVPMAISSLSGAAVNLSDAFKREDKLEISLNKKEVASGSPFTISWKNNTEDKNGNYTFSFKCETGIRLEYTSSKGNRPIICDTLFPLPESATSYSFGAISEARETVDLPLNITFWSKDGKTIKLTSSTKIKVLPAGSTESETPSVAPVPNTESEPPRYTTPGSNTQGATTTPERETPNQTPGSTPTLPRTEPNTNTEYYPQGGVADLSISLIQRGVQTGNGITNTDQIGSNQRGVVKFLVTNAGTAGSGAWRIKAEIPTKVATERLHYSSTHPSIRPGSSYEFTLSFDTFDPEIRNLVITLENVTDSNLANNKLTVPFNSGTPVTSSFKPDLTAAIIEVGVLDESGRFYRTNSFTTTSRMAIRFEVENKGGGASGTWNFDVSMPASGNSLFTSSSQSSIPSGSKKQFTLGFNNPIPGNQTIVLRVDSGNQVSEDSENNNTASRSIFISN